MKVIDKLQTIKNGYQYVEHKPLKYFSIDLATPTEIVENKNPVYETTAVLKIRQIGSGTRDDSFEKKLIHEQAAISIARELYGDILERLYDLREVLYEEGPRYDSKVLKLVLELISDLRLESDFK